MKINVYLIDRFTECLRLFVKERREQKSTVVYYDEVYYREVNNLPVRRLKDRVVLESRKKINFEGNYDSKRNDPELIRRELLGNETI